VPGSRPAPLRRRRLEAEFRLSLACCRASSAHQKPILWRVPDNGDRVAQPTTSFIDKPSHQGPHTTPHPPPRLPSCGPMTSGSPEPARHPLPPAPRPLNALHDISRGRPPAWRLGNLRLARNDVAQLEVIDVHIQFFGISVAGTGSSRCGSVLDHAPLAAPGASPRTRWPDALRPPRARRSASGPRASRSGRTCPLQIAYKGFSANAPARLTRRLPRRTADSSSSAESTGTPAPAGDHREWPG